MSNIKTEKHWEEAEQLIKEKLSRYPTSDFGISILQIRCPRCSHRNWITAQDPIEVDPPVNKRIEICECWACRERFWVSEAIKKEYTTELIMEQVFSYNAKKEPTICRGLEFAI